jgi:hypothetical protein
MLLNRQKTMYFHRHFLDDGSCKIICTRCFQTVGQASGVIAIKQLEAAHLCHVRGSTNGHSYEQPENAIHLVSPAKRPARHLSYARRILGLPVPLLLVLAILLLYGLPTVLEFALQRFTGPWLAGIILGDLTACICLFSLFKMRRTGVVLYLALTIAKISLYAAHAIPANVLLWITDSIPAFIVLIKIARLRTETTLRVSY